jgi:hypothetical protein
MNDILKRMATFFVALFSIFLLGDVLFFLQREAVRIDVVAIIVITTIGWFLPITFSNNFLRVAIEIIATQLKNLEEFFRAYREKILAMGAYQIWNCILDNPIWQACQLAFHTQGVILVAIWCFLQNAIVLYYHRNREAKWTGLDDFAGFLQSKEEDLTGMFFTLTSKRALIVFYATAILSPEPVKNLQALFLVFIYLEIAILVARKRGDVVVFFLLSFWQDSFITTAYFRRGDCKKGLKARDYKIFLLSSFVSIAYWIVRNGLIAELILRPILKV